MARTFRNKTTLPVGWAVRDDGRLYHNGNDVWGQALLKEDSSFSLPEYRRNFDRCEQTWARRQSNRHYRNQMNHLVRTGRWEDISLPTRTSGWLSW